MLFCSGALMNIYPQYERVNGFTMRKYSLPLQGDDTGFSIPLLSNKIHFTWQYYNDCVSR
jgi:hypothetical protein